MTSRERETIAAPGQSSGDIRIDLEGVLRELSRRAPGVIGSVVADGSGLPVASNIEKRAHVDVLAAMATLIGRSADSVFENMSVPGPPLVVIEGPVTGVALIRVGTSLTSLLCAFNRSANLGLVKIEMNRAATRIAAMLELSPHTRNILEELFVMTVDGVLLRHYSSALRTDIDRDILGGMLVAVQSFMKQTLATREGNLDELHYGEYTIYFVRATYTIAAAVSRGRTTDDIKYPVLDALQAFESKFGGTLESWNGDISAFPGIDEFFAKLLRS